MGMNDIDKAKWKALKDKEEESDNRIKDFIRDIIVHCTDRNLCDNTACHVKFLMRRHFGQSGGKQ